MKTFLTSLFLVVALLATAADGPGYHPGDVVQNFTLKNVDGKYVSLKDFRKAKGVIIVFTCNTCPIAKAYEQRVIDLNDRYSKLGYPVIAINPNNPDAQPGDSFEKMQQRAKEKGYQFPYLADPDHIVTRQFGATNTPHIFLLSKGKDGDVVQYVGAIDNDRDGTKADRKLYLEEAIKALQQGVKPATMETKAIGCTIKWKKS